MFLCLESAQRDILFYFIFYFFTFSDSMVRRECYFFFQKFFTFPDSIAHRVANLFFFGIAHFLGLHRAQRVPNWSFPFFPFSDSIVREGAKFDLLDSFAFFHRPQSVMYIVPVCVVELSSFFNSCNPVMCKDTNFCECLLRLSGTLPFFPLGSAGFEVGDESYQGTKVTCALSPKASSPP
jgi:hypothetical protein